VHVSWNSWDKRAYVTRTKTTFDTKRHWKYNLTTSHHKYLQMGKWAANSCLSNTTVNTTSTVYRQLRSIERHLLCNQSMNNSMLHGSVASLPNSVTLFSTCALLPNAVSARQVGLDWRGRDFTWAHMHQHPLGLGRLCENPIVDSIGQNNRPMR